MSGQGNKIAEYRKWFTCNEDVRYYMTMDKDLGLQAIDRGEEAVMIISCYPEEVEDGEAHREELARAVAEKLKTSGTLKLLGLACDAISNTGIDEIAQVLKCNSVLTSLDLQSNAVDHVGASALADALKVNSTLKTLDITWNPIGNTGAAAIIEALKDNRTLISFRCVDCSITDPELVPAIEYLLARNKTSPP